jgi:hypothetical protein
MPFTFPDPNTTPEFTGSNGITYTWDVDDGKWKIQGFRAPGDYVKKAGGDAMQGPLHITGGRNPNVDGIVSTLKTLNVDSGGSSSLNIKWNGGTKIYVGEEQTTLVGDLKFNNSGKSIYAQGPDKKGFTINNAGVFYEGNYTADKHIATKKNLEESIYLDPTDTDTNIYLKRTGDSMTGDLEIRGKRIVFNDIPATGQVIRANRNLGEDVDLLYLAHSGGTTLGYYDVRMTGNTSYNGIRFKGGSGGDEPIFEMRANGQFNQFHSDLRFDGNRILELGDAVDDTDAVPLGQVTGKIRSYGAKNESSISSTRDGLADLIAAEVLVATEDENYLQSNLMEHAVACWPADTHPLYHLIPQDYILMTRMFEGSKKTEDAGGNILSDNKTLDSDNYGNDQLSNVMVFHIPTGKIKDISIKVSHEGDSWNAAGTSKEPNKKPALRGHTVIPRNNGDVDVYSWIHNPRRNPKGQPGAGQPLVRIHIPANPNFSDPFAGVTINHTDIYCDPALLTTPDKNPYDIYDKNTSKDLKYQYEISQVAWNLVDSLTGQRHYFMMSYNKGSRDYVTQRVFEINFDESDPNKGTITPVGAHSSSTLHGDFVAGYHVIKKDVNDVFRCFLYGSPVGLTELYFKGDYYNRTSEIRNYDQYIPLGDRITDPTAVNGIGKPLIVGKGIIDNWYKSTTLAPQFLTYTPIDNDDYFSNIIVWYQSAYGVCTLNIQDLGTVDRSDEVHLENNYQGSETELSSMQIETKQFYDSYLQDSSSRNLMRFNVYQPDTHSHGSLYFFDYKSDYKFDSKSDGSIANYGEEQTLYNSTRVGSTGNNGKNQQQMLFKRPILEVRPNYKTGRVEVHAIVTGVKHHPSKKEVGYPESFNGESVTKFGDVFVCAGASKSHSSVKNPRVYIFDPQSRQIQRCSNTEVNSTGLIPCPDHGIVIGSSYGADTSDNATPIHMTSMITIQKVVEERNTARTLRKLYALTGENVADDPNTWTLDPPQTTPTSLPASVFTDSNETVWDTE